MFTVPLMPGVNIASLASHTALLALTHYGITMDSTVCTSTSVC
jgi:hypothetical protein